MYPSGKAFDWTVADLELMPILKMINNAQNMVTSLKNLWLHTGVIWATVLYNLWS